MKNSKNSAASFLLLFFVLLNIYLNLLSFRSSFLAVLLVNLGQHKVEDVFHITIILCTALKVRRLICLRGSLAILKRDLPFVRQVTLQACKN